MSGFERRFWVSLTSGVALLFLYGAFNSWIDPLGEIGWTRAHSLNRAAPPDIVEQILISRDTTNFYRNRVDRPDIDTFLIGSSRVAHGMDTCSRPGTMKVAGSAWGLREETAVTDMILAKRQAPATLLIEVGVITEQDRGPIWTLRTAMYAALAPATAANAISTLAFNLKAKDANLPCRAHSTPQITPAKMAKNLADKMAAFDSSPAARRRGRAMLGSLFRTADELCRRNGIRHRILFFSLPATMRPGIARDFDMFAARDANYLQHLAAVRASNSSCVFDFANMVANPPGAPAQRRNWTDERLWLNPTHFSPRLGALALTSLYDRAAHMADPYRRSLPL